VVEVKTTCLSAPASALDAATFDALLICREATVSISRPSEVAPQASRFRERSILREAKS
jgi:hypothetical protein